MSKIKTKKIGARFWAQKSKRKLRNVSLVVIVSALVLSSGKIGDVISNVALAVNGAEVLGGESTDVKDIGSEITGAVEEGNVVDRVMADDKDVIVQTYEDGEVEALADDETTVTVNAGDPATIYDGVKDTTLDTETIVPAQVSLSIGPEIAMGDRPFLDATAEDNAAKYYYRPITMNVVDASSYTVSLQGVSANLTSEDGYTIPSVTGETTLSSMPANHWGYSFGSKTPDGDTLYQAMPADEMKPIYGMSVNDQFNPHPTMTRTDIFYISFAAKVNKQQPAGTYTNQVIVSAVATPDKRVATFDGVTTMQQMNSTICKAARTNDTARLRDERDGRFYWVTKLADGNCWMSQNLQLNLSAASPLDSSTSDLGNPDPNGRAGYVPVTKWTPGYSTTNNLQSADWNVFHEQRSWTQGLYVMNTPTLGIRCYKEGDVNHGGELNSVECIDSGYIKVGDDWIFSDGVATNRTNGANGVQFVASTDPDFFVNNGGYAIAVEKDENGKMLTEPKTMTLTNGTVTVQYPKFKKNAQGYVEFDAHYLLGNWYQWNAAIAGGDGANNATTGKLTDDMSAPDSICPKNWKLPIAGDVSGTFGYLWRAYGVRNSSVTPDDVQSFNGKRYDIAQKPLFFVQGGGLGSSNTGLRGLGSQGSYWTATSGPTADAFISAHSNGFNTVGYTGGYVSVRYLGYSLRCLVR